MAKRQNGNNQQMINKQTKLPANSNSNIFYDFSLLSFSASAFLIMPCVLISNIEHPHSSPFTLLALHIALVINNLAFVGQSVSRSCVKMSKVFQMLAIKGISVM